MRIAKLAMAAAGLYLLLSACGTDEDAKLNGLETSLVGKWKIDSVATQGTVKTTPRGGATTIDTVQDTSRYPDTTNVLDLKADRTLLWKDFFEMDGNWSASGSTLTTVVNFLFIKVATKYQVTLTGNALILLEHNTDTTEDPDTGEKTQNDLLITRWGTRL